MSRLPRKSREQWSAIVKAFETTTQSTTDFCAGHGISPESLRKWMNKLKQPSQNAQATNSSSAFVPIQPKISDQKDTTGHALPPLRASFADGTTLEWSCNTPASYVSAVLECLR